MTPLPDQSAREAFVNNTEENLSLVAPAGTGKTTSITRRILSIARHPDALALLPRLVVVTYTNKAADELAARARTLIQENQLGNAIAQALQHARFSTIHGYCLSLIEKYGHYLGIARPDPLTDDDQDELIQQWERAAPWPPPDIPPDAWRYILHCFGARTLREAILSWPGITPSEKISQPPCVEISPEDSAKFLNVKNSRSRAPHNMRAILAWAEKWNAGQPAAPPAFDKGGKDFLAYAQALLAPINHWLQHILAITAAAAAADYKNWRRQNGRITFQDQIALAAELLQHPVASLLIRSAEPIVILDEAQDTDALQLAILTGIASEHPGEDGAAPRLRPGAFCMVGDPQQSIYGERASLAAYAEAEQKILASGGRRLALTVTFRCSRAVAAFVNQHAGAALDGREGQVAYSPITPSENAPRGQLIAVPIPPLIQEKKPNADALAEHQAEHLAQWLLEHPPHTLGASDAARLAILCPVKNQLHHIAEALARHNIPHTNLSPVATGIDAPALAWLYALTHILLEPRDEFEISGVLHEIFGLPDPDIYHWKVRLALPLHIHEPPTQKNLPHPVGNTLAALHRLHLDCAAGYPRECAEKIITATALDRRLKILFPNSDESALLAKLTADAAQLEAVGKTLRDYCDHLKKLSQKSAPPATPRPDHIQLLTCHAAKGLEWDAVIIPYLFTPKRIMGNEGCRWLHTTPPRVVTTSTAQDEDTRARHTLRAQQEYQRLAYVALTRARRSLILLDDSALHPAELTAQARSFGHLYNLQDQLTNLPAQPQPDTEITPAEKNSTTANPAAQQPLRPDQLHTALATLRAIPRRLLPHALAVRDEDIIDARRDTLPQDDDTQTTDTAAPAAAHTDLPIRYGLWWHHLMENLPWCGTEKDWQHCFEQLAKTSPDPARAHREWALFTAAQPRRHIPSGDPLIKLEEPFIWRLAPGGDLVEGVIDFLLYDTTLEQFTIIDWKTNAITPDEIEQLAHHYRPQLTHYRDAVQQLTGKPATAHLYSTATGRWSEVL